MYSQKLTDYLLLFILLCLSFPLAAQSPVEKHGQLSVDKTKIVNSRGEVVSLAGPSFFWSNSGWSGDKFYNANVVKTIAKDWNASIIRASVGVENNGGYGESPLVNLQRAERVIDAAIEEGLYVIIDWHSHQAENYLTQAIDFFRYMAKKYGDSPNVIYEIYNEPLRKTDWVSTVIPYSEQVVDEIRSIDPDNLIVIGTQTWSQDVGKVIDKPIKQTFNILYTLHFYAGSHKDSLINEAQRAIDAGVPIMVTEWGSVNATGDGAIDYQSSEKWLKFLRDNDLSHCSWSLTDKDEGSAFLKPGASTNGEWTDKNLTENGKYLKNIIKNWGY